MARHEPFDGAVLCMSPRTIHSIKRLQEPSLHVYEATSVEKASALLKKKQDIKVVLSDSIDHFEKLKDTFPDPVRILIVDKLDLDTTQSAINRGEIFRFLLDSSTPREVKEAVSQGCSHYDITHQHRYLLSSLKNQNKKLEQVISRLENDVQKRTSKLKQVEKQLYRSKRYLEKTNALIAWINGSVSFEDLQVRLNQALSGIIPIERIIIGEEVTRAFVDKIKAYQRPTVVFPLIFQKKQLGNVYMVCKDEDGVDLINDNLPLIKQVVDTVALTLEKIKIFNVSVKRKEEWEKTFDAIKDPVALVNQDFDIIRANLAYSEISGTSLPKLVGKKCYEVFQKRSSPCQGCKLPRALKRQSSEHFDLKSADQETTYSTASYPTVLDEHGLAVMYYRDQGEEKRLQDQLIQSEKMAEIGILAGSVAHEINNPLGGILAYTQILLSEVQKDSTIYEDLKEIERASLRSKNIVENLLYFSRASRREDEARLNIIMVIEKALSLLNLRIKHRSIKVLKGFERVPAIHGDFNQLVQVYLNLLQNAAEAIPKNVKGVIQIDVQYIKKINKIQTTISDNGRGISEDRLSQIFNPFYTTKSKRRHTGLGLSVGYRIVQEHHGDVKVESDPSTAEQGTKFVITFPVKGSRRGIKRLKID